MGRYPVPAAAECSHHTKPSCFCKSESSDFTLLFLSACLSSDGLLLTCLHSLSELVSGREGPLPGGDRKVVRLLRGSPTPDIHLSQEPSTLRFTINIVNTKPCLCTGEGHAPPDLNCLAIKLSYANNPSIASAWSLPFADPHFGPPFAPWALRSLRNSAILAS